MTASKVAAVLGLSPWESRFSLWHRMAGLIQPTADTDQTRRGHYLEDGVARWFADQHPEMSVGSGGAWAHPEREWQAASPDRLLCTKAELGDFTKPFSPTSLLEIKTAAYADEWGIPGSDAIPPYYRAQVVWQIDTLGLSTAYVAVLLGQGLTFAEYRIEYNADEADYIRAEAKAFMDSLPGGPAEQRPDIDAHSETYAVVRQLNPDINGEDVEVPEHLAREFCQAVKGLKVAEKRETKARSLLAEHMGLGKRAVYKPDENTAIKLADRRGASPYLQAVKADTLPDFEETLSA